MNRRQSEWNVFGHILTTSELSMYICMAVTFACGVASILVGIIVSVLAALVILASGILLLLLTFVWFQVGATRQMQMSLESEKIEIIDLPEGIFRQGISALERGRSRGGWRKVRIYAPVGLWDPSQVKTNWLVALQSALEREQVQSFSGVYALPPDKRSFDTYAKGRLELFENTPIRPSTTSLQKMTPILHRLLDSEPSFLQIRVRTDTRSFSLLSVRLPVGPC